MTKIARTGGQLEQEIAALLADPQHDGHPLREALESLLQRHADQLAQLERLTSISDGYHSALQERHRSLDERHRSLDERYRQQLRRLQKIVRISDHYQAMLQELNDKLKVASTQDPLTSLPNRRLMMERLSAEIAHANRRRDPFSLALIDVDHFKRINDSFGHDVGDAVLTAIGKSFREELRAYDVCARWGGEEFLALFPETGGAAATEIAERLRLRIASLQHPALPVAERISISVGVAQYALDQPLAQVIKRADQALYKAKRAGRNRVTLASSTIRARH